MKKQIILLFIVFTNTIIYSQTVSGKVTYVASMTPISDKKIDSLFLNRKVKNPKMNKWARSIYKNTPNVKSYLDFTNGESVYYVEDKMQVEGKSTFNMNRIFAGGDNKVYKNKSTKEYLKEYVRENLLIEKKRKNVKLPKNLNK